MYIGSVKKDAHASDGFLTDLAPHTFVSKLIQSGTTRNELLIQYPNVWYYFDPQNCKFDLLKTT